MLLCLRVQGGPTRGKGEGTAGCWSGQNTHNIYGLGPLSYMGMFVAPKTITKVKSQITLTNIIMPKSEILQELPTCDTGTQRKAQGTPACSPGEGDGTHSSTLAWRIPWTEEPGRLQSMGSLRVGHDWATSLSLSCIGEGNGNPLQCSCLENPRDGGAWWAAVYGVAQGWTLKRLSSSSSSIVLRTGLPQTFDL